MRIHPEVADALAAGEPVVALESTIISHGLPRPDNLRIAREIEAAVRAAGSVPATVAIVAGQACIGLDDAELSEIAGSPDVVKVSVREIALIAARRGAGATTVASTAHLAARAGIAVFATGGLGGVHREARDTWDESADLTTLSQTPIVIVCAGVKSILDVAATLERLETLNVGVVGYRTDAFPGFYLADSGHPVGWRVESPAEIAAIMRSRIELGTDRFGLVVANPVTQAAQLEPGLHDRTLAAGLVAATQAKVAGKDVTPFLLGYFNSHTQGAATATNIALVLSNARLAGEIAREFAHGARMNGHIVCLGDVMTDIVARLPGALAIGSDVHAPIRFLPGGSAANTAVWLAAAGASVSLIACIGADALGAQARQALALAGVGDRLQIDETMPTGSCIVLITPDGERTMVPDPGANSRLDSDAFGPGDFTPGQHLHVSGYALLAEPAAGEPPRTRNAALHALERARATGMTISVDAASAGPVAAVGADQFREWIGSEVLLFANAEEAAVLTGSNDPVPAARMLAAQYGSAVVKVGRDGAYFCADQGEVEHFPAALLEVLDSTGAGDAFAAGYLAAVSAGHGVAAALRAGNALAGQACRLLGGRPASPAIPPTT